MNIIKTEIKDLYIIEPKVYGDHRGWFMETWSRRSFEEAGLYYTFVQDNHSFSAKKNTIRGLHFQKGEFAQAKLVRCTLGKVLDVAVDIRKGSPTYLQWAAVELSAENKRQMLIPRGFAHGFATLTDNVEFLYKADNWYAPASEGSILWCDPEIGVNWNAKDPIIAEKDAKAPLFKDCDVDFVYEVKK